METGTEEIMSETSAKEILEESKSVKKRKNAQQEKPMIEEPVSKELPENPVKKDYNERLKKETKLLQTYPKDKHLVCSNCGSRLFSKVGPIKIVKSDQAIVRNPNKDNFFLNYEDLRGVFVCSLCGELAEVESLRKIVKEV